jgi:cyclopropane fatty-acyl-phospholipid synthase-like methyltransferase
MIVQNAEVFPIIEKESIDTVTSFFDQWQIYKKIMNNNYLHHFEIYAILNKFLSSHSKAPFTIIDLGCGDALFMTNALQGTEVQEYIGVELSDVALGLAKKNIAALNCDKTLLNRDFHSFMVNGCPIVNIIWMGLSLHHLPLIQKGGFIASCKEALTMGGYLMIFDPVRRDDEDREEYISRWWDFVQAEWRSLPLDEKQALYQHVVLSDFPETMSTFMELGRRLGFSRVFSPYCDDEGLYRLVCFRK